MFGIGKIDGLDRQAYNRRIKALLEERMHIETDDAENPYFPGVLAFGNLLDAGWQNRFSAEEAALAIAITYLDRRVNGSDDELGEAERIFEPISDFLHSAQSAGKLRAERSPHFAAQLENCAQGLGRSSD